MELKRLEVKPAMAMDKKLEHSLLERGIALDEIRSLRLTNSNLEAVAKMPKERMRQLLADLRRAGMLLKTQKFANELVIAFPKKWEEKLLDARRLQFDVPNMPEEAAVRIVISQKKPVEFVSKIEQIMKIASSGNMLRREEIFMLAANHPEEFEDYAQLASEAGSTRPGGHVLANCRSGARLSAIREQVPVFLRALAITPNMTFNEVKSLTKNMHRDPVADAELLEKFIGDFPGFSRHFCKMLVKFSPESRQRLIDEAVQLYFEFPQLSFYDCQKICADHSRIIREFSACFKKASSAQSAGEKTKKELVGLALDMARGKGIAELSPLD